MSVPSSLGTADGQGTTPSLYVGSEDLNSDFHHLHSQVFYPLSLFPASSPTPILWASIPLKGLLNRPISTYPTSFLPKWPFPTGISCVHCQRYIYKLNQASHLGLGFNKKGIRRCQVRLLFLVPLKSENGQRPQYCKSSA